MNSKLQAEKNTESFRLLEASLKAREDGNYKEGYKLYLKSLNKLKREQKARSVSSP